MFDNCLASTYGFIAATLIQHGLTGYFTTARGLTGPIEKWKCAGIPLTAIASVKGRSQYGENQAVIASHWVNLHAKPFMTLKKLRREWVYVDRYCNPGPIQFFDFGKYFVNLTTQLEHENYNQFLEQIEKYCGEIRTTCRFGAHEDLLQAAAHGLESLTKIIEIIKNKYES